MAETVKAIFHSARSLTLSKNLEWELQMEFNTSYFLG